MDSSGDVVTNAISAGSKYSAEQAVQDFTVGFITGLAGDALGDIIKKYGTSTIVKGLKRIGVPDNIINKVACFTADTKILTGDGYRNIMDIKVGEDVYSENPETGEKGLKKVKKVFVNETYTLIHVFAGKEEIKTTTEHPFWVVGKGWVGASALEVGDKLLMYEGKIIEVTAVEQEDLAKPVKVYNFEVEDWHTYFVSGTSVLVHNACSDIKWKGFSSGKLATHFKKHGSEFGNITQNQYMKLAKDFAA